MELAKILSPEVEKMLEAKKIYFTTAYFGQLRCYKHNELIWWASATTTLNQQGIHINYDYLYKKGKECIDFFLEHGYIPNMES